MSDAFYDYARYDGDSRSSWEKLTWVAPRHNDVRIKKQDEPIPELVAEPFVVYVQIKLSANTETLSVEVDVDENQKTHEWVDWNWRSWDVFDFLSIAGAILVFIG